MGFLSLGSYVVEKAYPSIARYLHLSGRVELIVPDLALELVNTSSAPISVYPRGDLVLWLPQGVHDGVPNIAGKYELVVTDGDGPPSALLTVAPSSAVRAKAHLLGKADLAPILEQGTADLELILRKEAGGIVFSGSIPFTKESLQSTRWQVPVGEK